MNTKETKEAIKAMEKSKHGKFLDQQNLYTIFLNVPLWKMSLTFGLTTLLIIFPCIRTYDSLNLFSCKIKESIQAKKGRLYLDTVVILMSHSWIYQQISGKNQNLNFAKNGLTTLWIFGSDGLTTLWIFGSNGLTTLLFWGRDLLVFLLRNLG